MRSKSSFTLIELLIVIGILAILVITILITLNPSEAQKKARDVKRMKDLATLEAIVLQWTQDGNSPLVCNNYQSGSTVCSSRNEGQIKSEPCSNNWLQQNVCNYTASVPVDPLNSTQATCVGGTVYAPITATCWFYYKLGTNGSDFKIGGHLESKSNINGLIYEGPNDYFSEIISNQNAQSIW